MIFTLIKDAPIPAGSSLQVLDGGAKVCSPNGGDALKVISDTCFIIRCNWVSTVDAISS